MLHQVNVVKTLRELGQSISYHYVELLRCENVDENDRGQLEMDEARRYQGLQDGIV